MLLADDEGLFSGIDRCEFFGRTGDGDRFSGSADLENEIREVALVAGVEVNALLDKKLKTGGLDGDLIVARLNGGDGEKAVTIGNCLTLVATECALHHNSRTRDNRPGWVGDETS